MNRSSEIREFLLSRRARITPQQAGLLAYGANRRVKGLRREEAAMLAGVSVDYYTRLERGHLAGASESVLDAVARALHLDEAERAHLFDLARSANASASTRRRTSSDRIRPGVQRVLDAMTGAPAWVRNGRADVLLHRTGRKDLHHPVAGDLDLTYEAFELPSEPGLTMLVYTAEPDTPTAEALGFLASWAATQQAEADSRR